jgi:hypothetical protein
MGRRVAIGHDGIAPHPKAFIAIIGRKPGSGAESETTQGRRHYPAQGRNLVRRSTNPTAVTNDPMESGYDMFNLWSQAVKKAGSKAIIGERVRSPTGLDVTMNPNHHLTKPLFISEIQADGQFNIVYSTTPLPAHPWNPTLAENAGRN